MKKYSWNIEKLLLMKKELERQYMIYEELLETYEDMLLCCNVETNRENNSTNVTESSEKTDFIIGAMDILNKYNYIITPPKSRLLPINDEELVYYTRKLFEQIPNKLFLRKFDYYTKNENNLLHIRHKSKLSTDNLGLSFVDTKNGIPFGLISRTNTIQDIISLAHECFHMIIMEGQKPLHYLSSNIIYREVEGDFADLLFSYLLHINGYPNDAKDLLLFDLSVQIDSAIESFIVIKDQDMKKDKCTNFNSLYEELEKYDINVEIDNELLCDLNEYLSDNMNDFISYLTAIDIFNNYHKDPEKALNTILNIPSLEGKKLKKDLSSIDVHFFEDGYINLDNHCKTLLKKRK